MADQEEILRYRVESEDARRKIEELGEGSKRSFDDASNSVEGASKSVEHFDDTAKSAVTGILGQLNPALGSLGNLAVDVVQGITRMSGALVGVIAVGAGISGLISLMRHFSDATREAAERLREMRRERLQQVGEGLGFEEQVRGGLREAGILGGSFESAQNVSRTVRELGVGVDVATFMETARRVQPDLTGEQLRTLGGAFLLRGQQDHFTRDQDANRQLIERMLQTDPGRVAEALAIDAQERGDQARAAVPPAEAFDPIGRERASIIEQIASREGLNAADVQRVRDALARGEVTAEGLRTAFSEDISWLEISTQGRQARSRLGGREGARRRLEGFGVGREVLRILEERYGELPDDLPAAEYEEARDLAGFLGAIGPDFPEGGTRNVRDLVRLTLEAWSRLRRSDVGDVRRPPMTIDIPAESGGAAPVRGEPEQIFNPGGAPASQPATSQVIHDNRSVHYGTVYMSGRHPQELTTRSLAEVVPGGSGFRRSPS